MSEVAREPVTAVWNIEHRPYAPDNAGAAMSAFHQDRTFAPVRAGSPLRPKSGHSGLRVCLVVWKPISDFVEVLAVREATVHIV